MSQKHKRTKGSPTPFDNRVRFNWGYHDAAYDIEHYRAARTLVEKGPHTIVSISKEYDPSYYAGYKYGAEDARAERYTGNSQAAWVRFKIDENKHKRRIRFWEPINGGWVKLTVNIGQELRWHKGSATDEGWSSETRTYLYEEGLVTAEIISDGVDCDGRLQIYWKGFFNPSDVKKSRCCLGQDNTGRNIYSEDMFTPLWQQQNALQRDFEAEAAGY